MSQKITILTMMPELFASFLKAPVPARAIRSGAVSIKIVDFKSYAGGSYRHIDDSPFGGGPGMILRCGPILEALAENAGEKSFKVLMSPAGKTFDQSMARRLSKEDHLVLVCGHYEGVDARVEAAMDELISIGDYILTGGETAAMVITEAVIRLLPGVLKEGVTEAESFEGKLLEYPQYTKPADFNGQKVPDVLLSGDHERIRLWRLKESLRRTYALRPDLLKGREFTSEEAALLDEIKK